MGSRLVRAAFALVVIATLAAFFATQQLKGEFPLVPRFAATPPAFSPNGDGVRDDTLVGFHLSKPAKVSFSIVDSEGNEVRRLMDERQLRAHVPYRFRWNGRDDERKPLPNGIYRMRVVRRDEGRVIDSIRGIRLDTRAPLVRLVSARPGVIAPGQPGGSPLVRVRYRGPRGPRGRRPELRIFRTDGGSPRLVGRVRGDGATRSAAWNGKVGGRPAPDGSYAFVMAARDWAGNLGVAPARVPSAGRARAGTGVTVRRLSLQGPLGVLTAGSTARLEVGPYTRSFRFRLRRLDARRAIASGRRVGGALALRLPRRARTGLYLVQVRSGGRLASWPLAVAGGPSSGRAVHRRRPLVVLPAISWQGLNPVDDDLDGFPDTLADARGVRLERPFSGGALPSALRSEAVPLLRFLDRRRLPYDLTTDLSLARGEGPRLTGAPGVALAGDARWLPPATLAALRRYVEGGGRLASFGADALRRAVVLRPGALRDPSRPRPADVFGERTSLRRTTAVPLTAAQDELHLFDPGVPLIGEFSLFERSERLPAGAKLLSAAGREQSEPAFVAYRLGRGLVIRSGTPQWAGQLSDLGFEVPRITGRIWRLLGGGG